MMDEWSWASKMGEEDDKSSRQWCVSFDAMMRELRQWCMSFSGGGSEDDESVRMMDEEDDG